MKICSGKRVLLAVSWQDTTLGELVDFVSGAAFPRHLQGVTSGDHPFIKVSDMNRVGNEREIRTCTNWISEQTRRDLGAKIAPAGTVVFPKVGAALKTEKRRILARDSVFDNNVMGVVPRNGVEPLFIYAVMESIQLGDLAQEGVVPSVNQAIVGSIPVKLPPSDEQAHIARTVAAADAAVEAAIRHAEVVHALSQALRRAAFAELRGELTELPDRVDVTMGRQRSPRHQRGEHVIPYLRAANVKDGYLALDDVLKMNFEPGEQEKYRLVAGDVMVTEGCGSLGQIGASARWSDEMDGPVCFQNTLLRLRAIPEKTTPEFVYQWARWAFEGGAFAAVATGTNIFHIGARGAAAMEFPVADMDVQADLASRLVAADAAADAAEAHVEHVRRLRSAVIARIVAGQVQTARTDSAGAAVAA